MAGWWLGTSLIETGSSTLWLLPFTLLKLLYVSYVQWSEDVIKADPFFGRSRVRFRVPPWVSHAIARDHLA